MYQQDQQVPEPDAPVLVEVKLGTLFVPPCAVVKLLPAAGPDLPARLVYVAGGGAR